MRSKGHWLLKAAAWGGLLFMHFPIAVIAMAGRFPGAGDVEQLVR